METHKRINNPHWCPKNVPTRDDAMIVTEGFILNSRDAINRHRTLFCAAGSAAEPMCWSACTSEGVNYTTNCFEDI